MKYIEIPLTKCKVYLNEKEILSLLQKDIELYKVGLIRGKAITRNKKQKDREKNLLN
jgi:hypothetical protein